MNTITDGQINSDFGSNDQRLNTSFFGNLSSIPIHNNSEQGDTSFEIFF